MKKIVTVGALSAGVLMLSACGDWASSPYPSGEIIELSEKAEQVEYDCTIDGLGDIKPESCNAEYVENCYMVRFVTEDGIEFIDCTDKGAWKNLDVGDDYTDD